MIDLRYRRVLAAFVLAALLAGCQSLQYQALETFGIEKREILAERVEEAQDAQGDAGEQFQTTLERFQAVVAFDGGNLEKLYNRLNGEYEDSVDEAATVRQRIEAVEDVAGDLFAEWESELERYSSADLRRQSRDLLGDTRARYREMIAAMRQAERAMEPVLQAFEDQVLFLKHNLNAMAIESIKGELATIQDETAELIASMQASIAEADRFLEALRG